MKEMTYILTCDADDQCVNEVTDEAVPLTLGAERVTIDLCDQHYAEFTMILGTALQRGVSAAKHFEKKRKSPTKKTVASTTSSKSGATSTTTSEAPAEIADPVAAAAVVDKSRACTFCGEVKKSNAGLAQHVRHKHGKTLAQHDAAEAKKKKAA